MCCCGKPNVNGTVGAYSWDGRTFSTRKPSPPDLQDGDTLVYDEPGRCGGLDCHSHHFRLVKGTYGHAIIVRHGGGDERIGVGCTARLFLPSLESLDSNGRYWFMHAMYSMHESAAESATAKTAQRWSNAAATGRIKTRKMRGSSMVKVWIEPPKSASPPYVLAA
jgi:hypothetical protein